MGFEIVDPHLIRCRDRRPGLAKSHLWIGSTDATLMQVHGVCLCVSRRQRPVGRDLQQPGRQRNNTAAWP